MSLRTNVENVLSAYEEGRAAGVIEGMTIAAKANCPGCAGKWSNVHPAERQHQLWIHRFVKVKSGRGRKWEGCMSGDIHDAIEAMRGE